VYRKIKSKSSRRLTERIKVFLDRPLVFVKDQVSWKKCAGSRYMR